MNLNRHSRRILLILFLSISCIHSQNVLYEVSATKFLMGTKFDIVALSPSVDSCRRVMYYALKEVERIENLMSSYKASSEISEINSHAGEHPVKVSFETYSIIRRSIEYSKKYDGLFDISIGPVSELWGLNTDHPVSKVPEKYVIDSLLKFVDYRNIVLNENDTTVFLPYPRMNLDLGGIAKGYAVDRASKILHDRGIDNYMVNGGGDLYVSGLKQDSSRWVIGIEHPRDKNKVIGTVELTNFALGTSGDYERYVIIGGKRYHHIFDPRTGYPAPLSQSASALAPTTEEAVILSKYLFIIGTEKYREYLKTSGVRGIVVDSAGNVFYDDRLLTENNFIPAK
ncbi:MAG: FAD:protein FMN transferase [Ignavibacteria bacterium]